MEETYRLARVVVIGVVSLRSVWCIVGFIRQFSNHRRAAVSVWGWVEYLLAPEFPLFLGVGYYLSRNSSPIVDVSTATVAWGVLAALLALTGLFLSAWAFTSYPSIGGGHYVSVGHQIVSNGSYGLIRHPTYAGVILIWMALALAFQSSIAAAITAIYVIPGYLLYMRREEEMMISAFGEGYERYRERVGMLVPRLRGRA